MRKSFLGAVVLAGMCLTAPVSFAESNTIIDLNVNGDAVRGRLALTNQDENNTGGQVDVGYLYIDTDTSENLGVLHGGILATGDASGTGNLIVGVGGRGYLFDADNSDGAAIGLGGSLRATMPGFNRLGLGGHLYFAPDILAFSDVEEFFEYGLRADYEVLRNATVYAGFRQVKVQVTGAGDETIDSGFHGGLQLSF